MKSFLLKRQPKAYEGSKTFKSKLAKSKYNSELIDALGKYNDIENIVAIPKNRTALN